MSTLKMFKTLDLETISSCNRTCVGCIRNSHPNKDLVASFFTPVYLDESVIVEALTQCKEMKFTGQVCLSHYNEPLMDERLPELVRLVKSFGFYVYFVTNGDYLTEDLAAQFDRNGLDKIVVSLYMDEPMRSKRAEWIKSIFHTTFAEPLVFSDHIATHFSPNFDVKALANMHKNNACSEAEMRVIINHRRQYLLCCDDVVGNFDLGTFPEIGIEDFWFGEKHTEIAMDLRESGGRLKHSYCESCPRA